MTKTEKHVDYLDPLRLAAAAGVVYLHVAGVLLASGRVPFGTADWELLNLLLSPAYSAVALFFLISGFLLLSSPRTASLDVLLKKRLPRLVVPLVFWTGAAALWLGHLEDDYSLAGFLCRFLQGLTGPIMLHFWFAFSLILLYALSPLLYRGMNALDRKGRIWILALIAAVNLRALLGCFLPAGVMRLVGFDLLDKLEGFGGELGLFLLGRYLGGGKRRVSNATLAAAALLLVAVITLGARADFRETGVYDSAWHRETLGAQVLLAVCLFLLGKQNLRGARFAALVRPVTALGMPIYYMHVLMMELLFGLGWTPAGFAGALGFTLANLLLCWLCSMLAASVPFLCYPVTGLRREASARSCSLKYLVSLFRRHSGAPR